MARLVRGELHVGEMKHDARGAFQREATTFRECVTSDDTSPYPVESGRYRLYVSVACPWCHRVLLARTRLGLEQALPVSYVEPHMGEQGWSFAEGAEPLHGARHMHQLYTRARPDFTGRITVPVLWDTRGDTIVNNESLDLLRMLDADFAKLGTPLSGPLFPDAQREAIDAMIEANYDTVNNAVYRAGFARSQPAYDEAVTQLFARLDTLEELLGRQRYLCGDALTAADLCLFPTLYRFDAVYYVHFQCTRRALREYPNLWGYTRDVFQLEGVRETCDMQATREHYFTSHPAVHPSGLVPAMPDLDFEAPHGRG